MPNELRSHGPIFFVDYCFDNLCEETCEPYPGGFTCLCPPGQTLHADGITCHSGIGSL